MSRQLPVTVEAHKLARQTASIDGFLLLSKLTRISDLLATDGGQIDISLQFEVSDRLHYVHGHITGEVEILCQRCMEGMDSVVNIKFVLGVMDNPEIAERLPEEIDPVYVDQGELNLFKMIEDELILALPLIAMHEEDKCSAIKHMQDAKFKQNEDEQDNNHNPFAKLKDLK